MQILLLMIIFVVNWIFNYLDHYKNQSLMYLQMVPSLLLVSFRRQLYKLIRVLVPVLMLKLDLVTIWQRRRVLIKHADSWNMMVKFCVFNAFCYLQMWMKPVAMRLINWKVTRRRLVYYFIYVMVPLKWEQLKVERQEKSPRIGVKYNVVLLQSSMYPTTCYVAQLLIFTVRNCY